MMPLFNQDARHIGGNAEADIDSIAVPQLLGNPTRNRLAHAKRRRLEARQREEDFT